MLLKQKKEDLKKKSSKKVHPKGPLDCTNPIKWRTTKVIMQFRLFCLQIKKVAFSGCLDPLFGYLLVWWPLSLLLLLFFPNFLSEKRKELGRYQTMGVLSTFIWPILITKAFKSRRNNADIWNRHFPFSKWVWICRNNLQQRALSAACFW